MRVRQGFAVRYACAGRDNRWRATVELCAVPEGVRWCGLVSFAAGAGQSGPPAGPRDACVTVVLECGPGLLASSQGRRAKAAVAMELADFSLRWHHPGAEIEHDLDEIGVA